MVGSEPIWFAFSLITTREQPMLRLAALLAAVAGSEAAAALGWCADSGPQLCRARCPTVDCGEGSCGMRQGTCCTFSCQPRSPDNRMLFCRALLLHAPAALPKCVHEVELAVNAASCADHVAMSEIREACGIYAPAASLTPIAVVPAQQRTTTRAPAKAEAERATAAPRNPLCVDSMVSCDKMWYAGKCSVASIRKVCCATCDKVAPLKACTKACPVPQIKLSGDGGTVVKLKAAANAKPWTDAGAVCEATYGTETHRAVWPPRALAPADPRLKIVPTVRSVATGAVRGHAGVQRDAPGKYEITYECVADAFLGGLSAPTKTRGVVVVDTTAPSVVPKLVQGQLNVVHELGTTYTDAGAKCIDPMGATTAAAVAMPLDGWAQTLGTHRIVYTCTKKDNGKTDTVIRLVRIVDRTRPTIAVACPAEVPTCKAHKGSVYAMCGTREVKKWGIGPEGEAKATKNCNWMSSKKQKWGLCGDDCTAVGSVLQVAFGDASFAPPPATCADKGRGDVSAHLTVTAKREGGQGVVFGPTDEWWLDMPGLYAVRYNCYDDNVPPNLATAQQVLVRVVVQKGGKKPTLPPAPTPAPTIRGCDKDSMVSCPWMAHGGRCSSPTVRAACCQSCAGNPARRTTAAPTTQGQGQVTVCPMPPRPEHGGASLDGLFIGANVTFACEGGYKITGSQHRTCLPSGRWSGSTTFCYVNPCATLPALSAGVVVVKKMVLENDLSQLSIRCAEGLVHTGASTWRCVNGVRGWMPLKPGASVEAPRCRKVCPRLNPSQANAMTHGWMQTMYEGEEFKVGCNYGFHALGGKTFTTLKCLATGKWDRALPVCKATQCGKPPAVPRASASTSCTKFDCVTDYRCDKPFATVGARRSRCLATGAWSPALECVVMKPCDTITCSVHDRAVNFGTFRSAVKRYPTARMSVHHGNGAEKNGSRHFCQNKAASYPKRGRVCSCQCYDPISVPVGPEPRNEVVV